jgi:ABC-2 type transport system permease protein
VSSAVPAAPPTAAHRVPPLGGFNPIFLGIEVRRLLRNRRTVIFSVVLPVVFYLLFRRPSKRSGATIEGAQVDAFVMVSLGVYGAVTASTSAGAMVAVERALGWSRQLRLTPLRPLAYMAIKVLTAMVLGALSVAAVFVVGAFTGVTMSASVWILSGLLAWCGALVFAAFGVMMGYLLPSENVMQYLGPLLTLAAFFGGILVPLTVLGATFENIAQYTPAWGIGQIAHAPLVGGGYGAGAIANLLGWTAAFVTGAALLFRRDTQRV